MKKALPDFSSEHTLLTAMSKKMGLSLMKVRKIWQRRDILARLQKHHGFALQPHVSTGAKGLKRTATQRRYRGYRLPGGGRKSAFTAVRDSLLVWFETQRCHGHSVKKVHILEQWRLLMTKELLDLRQQSEAAVDRHERAALLQLVSEGEKQLKSSAVDSGRNRLKQLMKDLRAKDMVPDLKTQVSEVDEVVRAKLTYQALDHTLWLTCFGPEAELRERVSKPAVLRANLQSMVLLFADQVPLWLKSGSEKEVYAKWESDPYPQSLLRQELLDHRTRTLADRTSDSQVPPLLSAELPAVTEKRKNSGQRQKRSFADPDAHRYRLTYEARQGLYNLCSDAPLVGKVLPGLLVVHGAHARLNNIDSAGKFISDETFEYNGTLVVRKVKTSAGRLLFGWRKARQSDPELFRRISVMSQPSANVDGVIYVWAQQELAALTPVCIQQRDCYAAAWSSSAAESLLYSNRLQTIIGPKMTASLQLTDTDFSRSFKSLHAGQTALFASGNKEIWHCSHLDLIRCVVSAQDEMSRRQDEKDWIVSGLRRNGILAYKPDLSSGKLVPLTDAECCGQSMGSARTKPSWLEDRFLWRVGSVPVKPDWSAIAGAQAVADLVEWSLNHPHVLSSEEEALLAVPELPEDLQIPCIESGVLTLSLDLQRTAWRKQLATSDDALAKKRERRDVKAMLALAKKKLHGKLLEAMRHRLKTMSQQQALARLVPRAAEPKSQTKKSVKKNLLKTASKKMGLAKALKEQKALEDQEALEEQSGSAKPPLAASALSDPVSAKAAELPAADKGPLFGKTCRVLLEEANCGKSGKCTAHNVLLGTVTLTGVGATCATTTLFADDVCEVEQAWLPPLKWKGMHLKRALKQVVCKACLGIRLSLEEDSYASATVELIQKKPQMLLDQHLLMGWEMLRWHFWDEKSEEPDFFRKHSVRLLDPRLCVQFLYQEHPNPGLLPPALAHEATDYKLLFVPVWAPGPPCHWTLLVLDRREGDEVCIQYLDTLATVHKNCAQNAQLLLEALIPGAVLPDRAKCPLQKSDDCGFWVLASILWICCQLRGEGPASRGSRSRLVMDLVAFLRTWVGQMAEEQKKLEKSLADEDKALKKALKANHAKALKLAASHAAASEASTKAAALAHEVLNQGKEPEASDLSASEKAEIEHIRQFGLRICSRCSWQSGCLDCCWEKRERYLLNKLRVSLGLAPLK
ncbi:unnamed protein product [Symbiodinium natans]|uniref:Ubiquitin-like protease family profile domain-containing protein n=1 Tax=Symbiodinium natans TaxID=878477 RepID=A0A812R4Z1_9DINO|nr:unnamed protein product [Symbiodinium natans]